MRRLWAYIITSLTAILVVGVSISSIFLKMNSNNEYQSGKELVFRISDKEDENLDLETVDNTDALDYTVAMMKERLANSDIQSYSITTAGKDTVKVAFSDNSGNDHYSLISNYLTFNGALALTDSGNKVALMENFRSEKKAYVTEENSLPKIVVPVNKDNPEFQAVIESAQKQYEEKQSSAAQSESEEEQDTTTYIYLWYDFDEKTDSYENSLEDETMAKKILMPFDIAQYSKDTESGEYPDELISAINVDLNSDQSASVSEIQEGFYRAKYFVNLLNAGELDYKVKFLYSTSVDATIESFIELGQFKENVAMTATLTAFLAAFVIVCLILVLLYRLGALSGIALTSVSIFSTLGFMVLFGVEINTASIVGLIAAAIVSLASFIIYQKKVRDEAYRGRSLKKANSEGMKKALLPIVDVNAAAILIGAFVYLLGGVMMRGLAAGLVLGGVISLLLNTLGLRGLMWMATNTTGLTGKYHVFGIEDSKVPNISNEEKQTYFGTFADTDYTKKKKPVGIIALLLTVASIAGMITFGALNKGQIFNAKENKAVASEIYFETVDREYAFSESTIRNLLDNMLIYEEGKTEDELKSIGSYVGENGIIVPSTLSEKVKVDDITVEHIHYFYVAKLDTNLKFDTKVVLDQDAFPGVGGDAKVINEILEEYISTYGNSTNDMARLKEEVKITPDAVGFSKITLATFIGIVVLSFYLALRYRPARAIAALLGMSVTGAITMGVFVLTRFPVASYILAMLPVVVLVSAIFMICIVNKEREMVIEDRINKDNSFEHRQELMLKANSYALSNVAVIAAVVALIAIAFFGFGSAITSHFYTFLFVGVAIAIAIVAILYAPVALMFSKLFSHIKFEPKVKENKKNKKRAKPKASKSAEPEEAIFIGIND